MFNWSYTEKVKTESQQLFSHINFIAQQLWILGPQLGNILKMATDGVTYFLTLSAPSPWETSGFLIWVKVQGGWVDVK